MIYDPTFEFSLMATEEAQLREAQKHIDELMADPNGADDEDVRKILGYYVRMKYEIVSVLIDAAKASREKQQAAL